MYDERLYASLSPEGYEFGIVKEWHADEYPEFGDVHSHLVLRKIGGDSYRSTDGFLWATEDSNMFWAVPISKDTRALQAWCRYIETLRPADGFVGQVFAELHKTAISVINEHGNKLIIRKAVAEMCGNIIYEEFRKIAETEN